MKKILVLILVMIFLITGCTDDDSDAPKRSFIGGDKGITFEFLEESPPDEVYDKEYPFSISVKLENEGEWDIDSREDVTLTVSGIDPLDFSKTKAELTKDVAGSMRSAYKDPNGDIVRGTIDTVDFRDLQYVPSVTSDTRFPVRVDLCYDYGTYANSKLCILDDLIGAREDLEDAVCNPNENKQVENSGAPVQITSLKESVVSSDRISFSFVIKHVGTGIVTEKDTECETRIGKRDRIFVKVDTGIEGLTCSGIESGSDQGYVTLYSNERTVVCTQQLPSDRGDYEKSISFELQYGYKEHIDKTLTIKHLEE